MFYGPVCPVCCGNCKILHKCKHALNEKSQVNQQLRAFVVTVNFIAQHTSQESAVTPEDGKVNINNPSNIDTKHSSISSYRSLLPQTFLQRSFNTIRLTSLIILAKSVQMKNSQLYLYLSKYGDHGSVDPQISCEFVNSILANIMYFQKNPFIIQLHWCYETLLYLMGHDGFITQLMQIWMFKIV